MRVNIGKNIYINGKKLFLKASYNCGSNENEMN